MKYTFAMKYEGESDDKWQTSAQRFEQLMEASIAAADWMVVCAFNGATAETKLRQIEES